MLLTERNASRPGDDPIFALNREATQRRAAGEKILNATVGALLEDDGSLAVLPSVTEALRAVPGAKAAGYAPIAGVPEFLAEVTKDLLGGTPLADVAVSCATPGGTGALRHAVSCFLDRGQSMVTSSFYWGPYATICDEHERAVRTFPMFAAHGGIDLAGFERTLDETAAAQGRLLVFLNDPCHNPTGYSMTREEWTTVSDVLRRASERVPTAVLADVAYLAYGRDRRSFLTHLAPLAERAAVLFAWSASKAFTQYGARVGALVACTADAKARGAIANARAFLPGMPSIFVDADLGVLLCRPASGSHRQWHTDQLKTEAVAQPTPNSAQSRLHSAAGIKSSYVSDSYAVPAGLSMSHIVGPDRQHPRLHLPSAPPWSESAPACHDPRQPVEFRLA